MRTCHPDCDHKELCRNGVCSCRPGHRLLDDGYRCQEIRCPPLPRPDYCPPTHRAWVDCLQPNVVCNQGVGFIMLAMMVSFKECFYAPGLKGPPGASSNRIVCLFICPYFIPAYKQSAIFKV